MLVFLCVCVSCAFVLSRGGGGGACEAGRVGEVVGGLQRCSVGDVGALQNVVFLHGYCRVSGERLLGQRHPLEIITWNHQEVCFSERVCVCVCVRLCKCYKCLHHSFQTFYLYNV